MRTPFSRDENAFCSSNGVKITLPPLDLHYVICLSSHLSELSIAGRIWQQGLGGIGKQMEVEHIGDAAECGASATEPSQQKHQRTNDTENSGVKEGLTELKAHLARTRAMVKYVRGSPQREQRFKKCVEMEGLACSKSVILDEPTRWNSTYLMLDIAMKYQKAFERLEEDDPLFVSEVADFVVLDPRLKLDYVKFSYSEILTSDAAEELTKKVRNALYRLYGSIDVEENIEEIKAIESEVVNQPIIYCELLLKCYGLSFVMVEVDAFGAMAYGVVAGVPVVWSKVVAYLVICFDFLCDQEVGKKVRIYGMLQYLIRRLSKSHIQGTSISSLASTSTRRGLGGQKISPLPGTLMIQIRSQGLRSLKGCRDRLASIKVSKRNSENR
ncbi:hypothetical protein MRB53_023859 [Persea americana]|uniref:Uncharacterized protein n=1 Tax=Persea americana TaxID=3435 RepID=A0ACC2LAQ5_PERAE|nr:hypothetical protein MRB53_023859 [Persea americana]